MITQIEVDGFKSLTRFKLRLNRGLNILVGPNGSGKTNIIQFFEFLSQMSQEQLGTAVSSVGGAGAIFQKIGVDDYRKTIKGAVKGCVEFKKNKFAIYEYRFDIRISFEKDDVYFQKQELKISSTETFEPEVKANRKWDVHVVNTKSPKGYVSAIKNLELRNLGAGYIVYDEKAPRKEVRESIGRMNPYLSILRMAPGITEAGNQIFADILGGETFNIIPSKVRESEDAASPPGIRKDGSGLATTLYAMKKNRGVSIASLPAPLRFRLVKGPSERPYSPENLRRIVSFLKAANSSISDLDVSNDAFTNRLIVKVSITSGGTDSILPLAAMSDGTIKWLALITAIFTSRTIFSIEEPENFLHPWMQAEIAEIMRTHLGERPLPGFAIMTTHSESLLNSVRPDEVIVVSLVGGKTTAKRVSRIAQLRREISETGFGLGHFYVSNTLSNA